MLKAVAIAIVLLALGACQESDLVRSPGSVVQSPSGGGGRTTGGAVEPTPDGGRSKRAPHAKTPSKIRPAPAPGSALPDNPGDAAQALVDARAHLGDLIERWRRNGTRPGDPLASDIELWALYQQRVCRDLAQSPELWSRTLDLLTGPAAAEAWTNVRAQRRLYSLLEPVDPPVSLATLHPAPARRLLAYYKEAEATYGVPKTVLAAVNFVETRFGRVKGPSSAGALGPMQFLPSTWDRYGNGGNILDPHDAILGAANYLKASGAPGDLRGALFAYNRADAYVDAVLAYASQMEREPDSFFKYYFWQVFVRTTKGDVQISGPGAGN